MDLLPYIDTINRQLALAAAAGGPETRALAERVLPALDASIRLTLQDLLAAAAEEITTDLAPGSVELRLRGRDPEFVVTAPPPDRSAGASAEDDEGTDWEASDTPAYSALAEGGEAAMSRINLRMPDQLKTRIEEAAAREGLSVNAWLVRAASTSLERARPDPLRDQSSTPRRRRLKGWAR